MKTRGNTSRLSTSFPVHSFFTISKLLILAGLFVLSSCQSPPAEPQLGNLNRIRTLSGFDLPETVVFHESAGTYLVSNMAGHPTDKNNDGFISTIDADTFEVNLKAITGTKEFPLHAPKGMAIDQGILYVADIDAVSVFDLAAKNWVARKVIENAVALNDVAINQEGKICLSDPKLIFDDEMESTQIAAPVLFLLETATGRIDVIDYPDGEQPNGVEATGRDFLIVPLIGKNIMRLDSGNLKLSEWIPAPKKLDGIERLDEGSVLVSSLEEGSIFELRELEEIALEPKKVVSDLKLPGNFCLDRKNGRLVIPLIGEGQVALFSFDR